MHQIPRSALCFVALAWSVQSSAFAQPSFRAVGTLGGTSSQALGVASSGAACGTAENASFNTRAFRSTSPNSPQDLGTLGGAYSECGGISASGTVIVGGSLNAAARQRAFRWQQASGMQDLGTLTGQTAFAIDASADGSVVVGWATLASAELRPFRWTLTTGMQDVGTFQGGRGMAQGVSMDGLTVVGFSRDFLGATRAFQYREGFFGISDLGSLGGGVAQAAATNQDGTIIVGTSLNAAGDIRPFVWRENPVPAQMSALPLPAGSTEGDAFDISADGATIVGSVADAGFVSRAALWSAQGFASVQTRFAAVVPSGWALERATSISPDGRFIAGIGINPNDEEEGWVIDTGAGQSACDTIDFNRDSVFPDSADVEDFLNVFAGGVCSNAPLCGDIDFNNDGVFPDASDIEALLRSMAGGNC